MPDNSDFDHDNEFPEVETVVFRSGNSDAVRLPRGYSVTGMHVRLRKLFNGDILIASVRRKWPPNFFETLEPLSDDFEIPDDPPISAEDDERDGRLFDED